MFFQTLFSIIEYTIKFFVFGSCDFKTVMDHLNHELDTFLKTLCDNVLGVRCAVGDAKFGYFVSSFRAQRHSQDLYICS